MRDGERKNYNSRAQRSYEVFDVLNNAQDTSEDTAEHWPGAKEGWGGGGGRWFFTSSLTPADA